MRKHEPVLRTQVVEALAIIDDGIYVDSTFGRGGHSTAILAELGNEGRLLAIDRDESAVAYATETLATDPRFIIAKSDFAGLRDIVNEHVNGRVDGILLDLGVSSPQLDNEDRGFSFLKDGPLDMRMDQQQGMDARTWLAQASLQEIRTVIKIYGEEKYAHRIAKAIVEKRSSCPLGSTRQLASLIESVVPRRERRIHPATRTFQAIRIHINSELDQLKSVLKQTLNVLKEGGRLVVISFHSLEDRIVKRFIRDHSRDDILYSGVQDAPQSALAKLKLVGKPVRATEAEVQQNPRARSAIMRIATRINVAECQS